MKSEQILEAEQIFVVPVMVAGGSSVDIEVISEKGPFRAHSLIMTEADARNFLITDIKVGRNSQFVAPGAVPASFFARRGMIDKLLFDKLPRGMKMSVCATNMDVDPKTFVATLIGMLDDDGPLGSYPNVETCPYDRIVLGLGHTIVPANSTSKITVQPQVVCKTDHLVIPTEVLDGMRVKSVRARGEDVLLAELKDGEADLKGSLLHIADWFCVEVANLTDKPKAFYGAVGGRLVR